MKSTYSNKDLKVIALMRAARDLRCRKSEIQSFVEFECNVNDSDFARLWRFVTTGQTTPKASIPSDKKLTKLTYLALVKSVSAIVKSKGWDFDRVYSEPRKSGNGYRTKFYHIFGMGKGLKNAKKIAAYINKNYAAFLTAEAVATDMWPNVIITPNTPISK